jgi:large subunit ribosomal protein L13|tara:strand:+ start:2984 stop:3439 length:456 start_codon:yes stop_codon:yes gene_type:complete
MNVKTTFEGVAPEDRAWYIVDATELPVGRLASEIVKILRGKNKPQFAPHLDVGDHVIVINASKVELSGDKANKKIYYSHSGYPGGLKEEKFSSLRDKKPEKIIEKAVWGMLPKNRLGRATLKKLHIFSDAEHVHESQNPEKINLDIQKVRR